MTGPDYCLSGDGAGWMTERNIKQELWTMKCPVFNMVLVTKEHKFVKIHQLKLNVRQFKTICPSISIIVPRICNPVLTRPVLD